VLLGHGDGTFQAQTSVPVGRYPVALLGGDFNNDGRLDFALIRGLGQTLVVGLGLGDGTFVNAALVGQPIRSTPLVGDLNGDGTADVAILAGDGRILVRFGNSRAPGTFAPPVVLNPEASATAQDLTLVTVNGRQELAALDARDGTLSFYSGAANNQFVRTRGPALPMGLPMRIVAGDLDGDGRQDLVVTTIGLKSGQVAVYSQQPDGTFGPSSVLQSVGVSPSDVELVNLTGGPDPDLVVTDRVAGLVHVLFNGSPSPFTTELSFRTGTGVQQVLPSALAPAEVSSPDGPSALVVGKFSGTTSDLVVVNQDSHRFSLLTGDGLGGFLNPRTSLTFRTGAAPTAVVAGDFNNDGFADLAVLDRASSQVLLYRGDGQGGFLPMYSTMADGQPLGLAAGNAPDGLTVADANGDGHLDLLVGNANGDVLTLLGNGDGSFQPYERVDHHVALALLPVNGQMGFVLADQAHDEIMVQDVPSGQSFQQGRQDGVLAPNAVKLADLNGDGLPDLIVANGGGNDILVYLGQGNGRFGLVQRFFVGTNPVGITVNDLNGDGLPDLVIANEGSNDVSLLYSHGRGDTWTLMSGPRLRAGVGPVATVVQDVYGNGLPDLLVANSESNSVYLLPGVGQGFFNDKQPVVFSTGEDPEQVFVGHFDNQPGLDLVTVNAGSSDLTFFPHFGPGHSIATGGESPTAAVAGDFGHDGYTDLLVLNSGDNHVSLLMGSSDGPQLTSTLVPATLVNLSDLALGAVTSTSLSAYVTSTEDESVIRLTFGLEQPSVLLTSALDLSPVGLAPSGVLVTDVPLRPVADFSSLPDLPLSVLATLFFTPPGELLAEAGQTTMGNEAATGTSFPDGTSLRRGNGQSGGETAILDSGEAKEETPEEMNPNGENVADPSPELCAFLAAPDRYTKTPLGGQEHDLGTLLPQLEWFDLSSAPPPGAQREEAGEPFRPALFPQAPAPIPDAINHWPLRPGKEESREESLNRQAPSCLPSVEPQGKVVDPLECQPRGVMEGTPSLCDPASQVGDGVFLRSVRTRLWPLVITLMSGSLAPLTWRKPRRPKNREERTQRHESL
jgi:hypothetical protein